MRLIHRLLSARIIITAIACATVNTCSTPNSSTPNTATSPTRGQPPMKITGASERESIKGSSEYFTGEATIEMLFAPNGPRDFSGAYVTFQPGARTAWHVHPAGQTIIVTKGKAWVQNEGKERVTLKEGDVLWTPPGVRHWHGATTDGEMTHLVVQGVIEGTPVHWKEHVSDTEYNP